jgi:hypothetical protein
MQNRADQPNKAMAAFRASQARTVYRAGHMQHPEKIGVCTHLSNDCVRVAEGDPQQARTAGSHGQCNAYKRSTHLSNPFDCLVPYRLVHVAVHLVDRSNRCQVGQRNLWPQSIKDGACVMWQGVSCPAHDGHTRLRMQAPSAQKVLNVLLLLPCRASTTVQSSNVAMNEL